MGSTEMGGDTELMGDTDMIDGNRRQARARWHGCAIALVAGLVVAGMVAGPGRPAWAQSTEAQRLIDENNRRLDRLMRDQDGARQRSIENDSLRRQIEIDRERDAASRARNPN